MHMTNPTVAVVTKTYAPDLERCELLRRSVDIQAPGAIHSIIVDAQDGPKFVHLEAAGQLVDREAPEEAADARDAG